MTLSQCVLLVAFVQLFAVCCDAASSTDTTLSACDYTAENLYVVNEAAPGALFPTGYVECAGATGSDAGICEVCSCREKKVASVAGVTVAWVVCVGSGDATTCVNSGQEYCSARSIDGSLCSQDGSSSCGDISADVGDSDSGSHGSSSVGIADGSDISAGTNDTSSSSSASTTTASASGSVPSSTDASAGIDIGNSESSSSADSTVEFDPVVTLSPGSSSGAVEEDNVITDVVGTVEPSQTSAATSPEQNIIQPSGNDGSTQELDTNNGTSSDSTWSGERLTVVLTVMCGIAAVAAIAVFVAVRKDQARKRKAVGTPVDDFTDDDCSVATPMTHRLDGRYRHGRREHRFNGGSSNGTVGSSDNTPLASIVVIGLDDDFQACGSAHQYRSYAGAGRKMSGSGGGPRTNNAVATSSRAPDASRRQFNVSHGPSMSDLPESTPDPIFDTSNTQVSFSSSMSSECESAPADRLYASEDSLTGSFRMVSATYSESDRGSDTSTLPRDRQTSTSTSTEDAVANNTIVSFASSLSSLHSSQYDVRDTEASEHMHDSDLYTNSSRVAISFDVGSYPASTKHQV